VLVGFRRDLNTGGSFTLRDLPELWPTRRPTIADLLEPVVDAGDYSPRCCGNTYRYAQKHQAKGNGFGFGMVDPTNPHSIARTLSARYYKDGAEIAIDRGWDKALGERDLTIQRTSATVLAA
jgi:DNA (cytosine-5)-methyltransferase 1